MLVELLLNPDECSITFTKNLAEIPKVGDLDGSSAKR